MVCWEPILSGAWEVAGLMAARVPELEVSLQERGPSGLRVESGGNAPAGFCLSGRGVRQSLSGQAASADSRTGRWPEAVARWPHGGSCSRGRRCDQGSQGTAPLQADTQGRVKGVGSRGDQRAAERGGARNLSSARGAVGPPPRPVMPGSCHREHPSTPLCFILIAPKRSVPCVQGHLQDM